ncbi:MAG: adenosylcobinamide-GDP ribazoletransferase [bacterium]
MKRALEGFVTALSFLTVFPVRASAPSDRAAADSVAFYPVVGYMIGAVLAGAGLGAREIAGAGAGAVVTVAAWLIVTRCLHFDGMTDVADGFLAGGTPQERFGVMKDSRIGAFGTAAGIVLIAGKIVFISQLSGGALAPALLLAPAAARLTTPFTAVMSLRAAGSGLGAALVNNVRGRTTVPTAVFFLAPAVFVATPSQILLLIGCVTTATVALVILAHRKIGGVNGDVFGAAIEAAEWLSLLAMCAAGRYNI